MFGSRKTLSEEEYVEEIRRRLRSAQRVRPVFLAMFSLMVCLIVFVLYTTPKMISNTPYERVMVHGGICLGVFIGFMHTIFVALAGKNLKHWLDFQHGFRMQRRLLDYHDRLKALGALPAAPDRPDSRPSTPPP